MRPAFPFLLLAAGCTQTAQAPRGSCGHAHNDQANERPLLEALQHAFCSVEVDVHLVDGQLLVGHDPDDLAAERTLESLYLDPLAADPVPIFLMLDVKTDAEATWEAIDQRLEQLDLGPVRVLISGNVARDRIASAPVRRAAIDGRIADLEAGADPELFPLISNKWISQFTWAGGLEPMPPDQKRRLRDLVELAHAGGHQLRFWQTADKREIWEEEIAAGVDLINGDDIPGLASLLASSATAR